MATIYVTDREGTEHVLEVESGLTLMEPLRELDDGIEALCGGMCSCATCHVFVEPQWTEKLAAARDDELELLEDTECYQAANSRLCCQITIADSLDGMRVKIAPEE